MNRFATEPSCIWKHASLLQHRATCSFPSRHCVGLLPFGEGLCSLVLKLSGHLAVEQRTLFERLNLAFLQLVLLELNLGGLPLRQVHCMTRTVGTVGQSSKSMAHRVPSGL